MRALRGPDIGSDHNLLKVKTGNKYNGKRKIVNYFSKSKVEIRVCYRNSL
jgi:hypothetical protein